MAQVQFKKGLLANLPANYSEGTFYVTTDERAIYLDVSGSERIRLGDFQEFANIAALEANSNPSTSALYYVTDLNVLAKWDGTKYVQINLDTGATSVEVVGDGNAVTSASYNATTRKLTLTKGATYATPEVVDGKISTAVGTLGNDSDGNAYANVKAYVDAKTSGIATDAALGELQGRVKTAEDDIDAIELLVGSKSVETQINEKIEGLKLSETYEPIGKGAEEAGKVSSALESYKTTNDAAVKAASDAAGVADGKAVAAQNAVDALSGKVGDVPADKTVVQMISDAQTAATYDDTKVKEDIQANADAIAVLNDGATVEGSVDYKIAQAVAAIMENPDETMNSINELVTWINGHAEDALELSNKVTANEEDIAALEGLVGTTAVATQITDAIAAALKIEGVDKYALATDLTAAIGRIAAMEAKVSTWDSAEKNAKDYADGLNSAMNTRVEALEAIDHDHSNKDELDLIASGDKAKWDEAYGKAHTHSFNETELNKIAEGDVAKWNSAEQNAKNYADGLASNYDASGSAATAESNAKTYAEGLMTWGSF